MKKKVIRWGILGCGDVTEVKSGPPYQTTEGFELAAVMRRDYEKVKDYAQRHQVQTFYTDADTLIHDPNLDAIYIATPPDTHLQYALQVAEAGKPCCIEKPMAPTYEACQKIYHCFEEKKLPLFIAYYRRSLPRFLQVKEWLEANTIGTLRHVHWTLHKPPSPLDLSEEVNWRTDPAVAPGGYFEDLASHGLDLFAYLIGEYQKVTGFGLKQQNLYGALDAVTACWVHNNGCTGTASWNFNAFERKDEVRIEGSRGVITFSMFQEEAVKIVSEDITEEKLIPNPKHVQAPHIAAMRDALLKHKNHPSTGKTGLHTSWVMHQILSNTL